MADIIAAMMLDLVDVAENGWGLTPALWVERREIADDLILVDQLGPDTFRMALRNRFAADGLDGSITKVREWFKRAGRDDFTWIVGTRSAPADLVERLLSAGASPTPEDPELAAMVLSEEPAPVDAIEIRLVETFAESLVARDLIVEILQLAADQVPSNDEHRRMWEASRKTDWCTFVAYVDGIPAGRASCASTTPGPLELLSAAVLPAYRGRGIYRALLRARWDEAVRRKTPLLVTQAGALSRPILERVGFKTVGAIQRLRDDTRLRASAPGKDASHGSASTQPLQ